MKDYKQYREAIKDYPELFPTCNFCGALSGEKCRKKSYKGFKIVIEPHNSRIKQFINSLLV